jgi:hypothetical protein
MLQDADNGSNVSGFSSFNSIADWVRFGNSFRTWGREPISPPAWPNLQYQGACSAGADCRIFDWRVSNSDTIAYGIRSTIPDGDQTSTATVTGSDDVPRTTRFLRGAYAVGKPGSSLLCTSGSTCVFMPNIGAYQGNGRIVPSDFPTVESVVGSFSDSVSSDKVTDVRMFKFESNISL